MLDILERFVQDKEYTYQRMDGGTAIGSRLALIEQFNQVACVCVCLWTIMRIFKDADNTKMHTDLCLSLCIGQYIVHFVFKTSRADRFRC